MEPTIGRIVHYVSYGTPGGEYKSKCRAAVVAAVGADCENTVEPVTDETCDLVVLNPTGLFFNTCDHNEDQRPGTWHWPERV